MKLWHPDLIHHLPNNRLLEQHSVCCNLRGLGWNHRHTGLEYVLRHPYRNLHSYHIQVISECKDRKLHIDMRWEEARFRGPSLGYEPIDASDWMLVTEYVNGRIRNTYPEHDNLYLKSCLDELQLKKITLINGMSVEEMLLKLACLGFV